MSGPWAAGRVTLTGQFAAIQCRLRTAQLRDQCLRCKRTKASFDEQDTALKLGAVVGQFAAGMGRVGHHHLSNEATGGWRCPEHALNVLDCAIGEVIRFDVSAHTLRTWCQISMQRTEGASQPDVLASDQGREVATQGLGKCGSSSTRCIDMNRDISEKGVQA